MSLTKVISNNLILERVCDFLDPTQLLQCAHVSKEWRYYFSPRLWNFVDLNWQDIDSISSFHQNQELTSKTINVSRLRHSIINEGSSPLYPNQLLKVYHPTMSTWSFSHLALLSSLINLRSLYLLTPHQNPKEPICNLPDVLKGLTGLRRLDLIILTSVKTDLLQHIISSAYHCESLHVTINVDTSDPQLVKNLRRSIEQLPITNIQDLKIKTLGTDIDLLITAPLLKKSPRLTCLYLCEPYTCETLQQVSNFLLDDSHSQLKYLGVEEAVNHLQDNSEYWDAVRYFFRDVSNKYMNSEKQPVICFKHTVAPKFREIKGDDRSRYPIQEDIILNVYSRCFSETLTSLELERFSISGLIVLLCRLPLLLNLSASVFLRPSLVYPSPNINAINFQEAPLFISDRNLEGANYHPEGTIDDNLMTALSRVSWMCTGIKSIKLWIGYVYMNDFNKVLLDCLFKNMGKLYQLEELILGAEDGILTTSIISSPFSSISYFFPGHLLFLKDLRRLSRVNLRNYGVYKTLDIITLNDIMFMINSWPELQHLMLQSKCLRSFEKEKIADVTRRRGIRLSIFNDVIEK